MQVLNLEKTEPEYSGHMMKEEKRREGDEWTRERQGTITSPGKTFACQSDDNF